MIKIIEDRQQLQTDRTILIDRIDEQHKDQVIKKYLRESDKWTPYHFHRNMNQKMNSQISMIRTEKGKLLIAKKNDDYVHEHFSKKFQTKKNEFDKINQDEQEDEIPAIK